MDKRELLQKALDALENECKRAWARTQTVKARDALRAELAKPEPEPKVIGWFDPIYKDYSRVERIGWTPLYRKEDL